jgi:hypothetical protein
MKFLLRPLSCAAWVAFCLLSATFDAAASGAPPALQRYLIRFDEVPLARYNGAARSAQGTQASLIPQRTLASGRARLDVTSTEAISYVDYLRGRQDQHLADVAAAIGRVPETVQTLQHALSGAIVLLSPTEAAKLSALDGVAAVEPEQSVPLQSDVGPTFTSAASVWWGTRAGEDTLFARGFENTPAYRGDGVVIGDIDTGYNSASPSFKATDLNGARIANPLGSGHYLGQCGVPMISIAGCNDKVIGVYDEIGIMAGAGHAPYTVEDEAGHGSHTASIAAGNLRMASLDGYMTTIAGVAPHANLVVYRVCDPFGSCSSTAIVSAINHAIADGVVDALNFSLGGPPADVWSDSVSLSFLAAVDAGIFVAAAAGNATSTPTAGSLTNDEPWVTTVAASWHSGGPLVSEGTSTVRAPAEADMLSSTSLLGPATFDAIKPDLQAPGMHILAAIDSDGTANGPALVGMKDGTSMATAHVTGAGALLLGLHPDWTPLEARSALMLTAKEAGLTKADGVTASDYFDRGSGRLQEFVAANAGLVMDDSAANMTNANPAIGGEPGSLNFASMQKASCAGSCTFTRKFHSTQNHSVTWYVGVVAGPNNGFSSVTASPGRLTVGASADVTAVFTANTSTLPADGSFHFAEIVLTPDDHRLPPLHLTMAVAVP